MKNAHKSDEKLQGQHPGVVIIDKIANLTRCNVSFNTF